MKQEFLEALKKLRESKKRKFDQTVDLIINLKDFDPRRESVNTLAFLPRLSKKKKICAFLEKSNIIPDYVITKQEMERLTEQDMRSFIKNYDFFIANAKLMPQIASKFGKILGMVGKMPDPKIGSILMVENDENIAKIVSQLSKAVRIKSKEASIKIAIAKESMEDKNIVENAEAVYNIVENALPRKKENIRSVMLKLTMSKPEKVGKKTETGEEKKK